MRRWPDGSPRVPLSRCPLCGEKLDAVSVLEGPAPEPKEADVTVCFGCGELLQFDAELRLIRLPARQLASLEPAVKAELRRTQKAVRAFLAQEGKRTRALT